MIKSLINPFTSLLTFVCLLPQFAHGFDVDGYMSCNISLSKAIISGDETSISFTPSSPAEGADARVEYKYGQGALSVFVYIEEAVSTFLIVDSFIWTAKVGSGDWLWLTDDSKFGKKQYTTSFARFSPDLIEIRPERTPSLYLNHSSQDRWHGLVFHNPRKMLDGNGVSAGFYSLDCVDVTRQWSLALGLLENAESDN